MNTGVLGGVAWGGVVLPEASALEVLEVIRVVDHRIRVGITDINCCRR